MFRALAVLSAQVSRSYLVNISDLSSSCYVYETQSNELFDLLSHRLSVVDSQSSETQAAVLTVTPISSNMAASV